MSGAPNINGTSQFPNPPIRIGITIKKIIIKAWAVTITLYIWSFLKNEPGWPSSIRIIILKLVPIIPDQSPVNKYKVPISLWLQDQSHFSEFHIYMMNIFSKIKNLLCKLLESLSGFRCIGAHLTEESALIRVYIIIRFLSEGVKKSG